jgi:hypothetical protein
LYNSHGISYIHTIFCDYFYSGWWYGYEWNNI